MATGIQDEKLGTEPIGRLIIHLALPSVAAQLINVLYNMVDRMYIGHIPGEGALALTGLGVSLPIIMLISAFSAFVGMGGAPLASIELGKGNREGAERILGNGVTLLFCFSLCLTIGFSLFKTPLLYMFGASVNTISYGEEYLKVYLLGTIFVQASLGLNPFISSQGYAKIAMGSVLIGAVLNIILDPVFIFFFHMGVKGAALATITAQAVSAFWILRFLVSKKSGICIRKKYLKPDPKVLSHISSLGISPFIMQSTESFISIVLNSQLQKYGGDLHVGALTILQSVMQLVVIPVQGISQGIQPIISYNYGAGNRERIEKTFQIMTGVICTVTTLSCLFALLFPAMFAKIFTKDAELIMLVSDVLPIFLSGIWIFGAQMSCQTTFMGLGQAKISLFIALLRKVFLLIPLAYILPLFLQVRGIYFAEPLADITAAIFCILLFLANFKKILGKASMEK